MRLPTVGALARSFIALAVAGTYTQALTDDIVLEFLERIHPQIAAYEAIRRLEARNERFNVTGWLKACTELQAGRFEYDVRSEGGSGYIRNRVLRKALDSERDLWTSGEMPGAALCLRTIRSRSAVPARIWYR